MEELLGERVDVGGAGRTDAGVHAIAQVAHLRARRNHPAKEIQYGLNDRLPSDINILRVEEAHPKFHARHDALMRYYLYQISTRRTAFAKPFVWWIKDKLDVDLIAQAASRFVGRRDFASFCDRDEQNQSTIVEVYESRVEMIGALILYRIGASHFLWRMVRPVVGTLAQVGRGEITIEDVEQLLRKHSREPARWSGAAIGTVP